MMLSQADFDTRLEWGVRGVNVLAPGSNVVVIVDVLSLSTSVESATSRNVFVYPVRQRIESGKELLGGRNKQDVLLACELNVSACIPLLQDGAYHAE